MLITAKILLTIATLGYSAIPTLFDFNETHATNPSWTGHARWHVVWQVSSYDYMALMALYLTWTAGTDIAWLWVPALLATFAYGGFWTAFVTRNMYGGILKDKACPSSTTTCSAGNSRSTPMSRCSRPCLWSR